MDYEIESFTEHESYNKASKQNDIALIKLTKNVPLNDPTRIRPACLWQSHNIGQQDGVATGWGFTQYGGSLSNNLMKVLLPMISIDTCKRSFEDDDRIVVNENQICAGVLAGGKDTCQGGEFEFVFYII